MTVATFTSILNQLLPEPHAGLLSGILFGTKATIPKDLMDALIATGTLHIVALSGMNITILESLIAKTLGNFLNKRVTSVLTILLIIGFILFVGPSPSVIRAGIMGSLALIAIVFGRPRWSLFFYSLTIAGMLIVHPAWITDLSFQLSALATLGIILFGSNSVARDKIFEDRISSLKDDASKQIEYELRFKKILSRVTAQISNIISDDLRLTLAAQTFTIPLILLTFRRISVISPVTNILIGWVIPPLTALGLFAVVLGLIWLPLGQMVAWCTWVILQYLILVIEWTAKIPFSSLNF